MLRLQFAVSLWLYYFATASSLSIPTTQQIPGNNTSFATLLPTTSFDLSQLPPIPGFRTDIRFAQTATVPRHYLFGELLAITFAFATWPEEDLIPDDQRLSSMGAEVRLVPSPSGPGAQLKAKHAVRALYEACFALSKKIPCCRQHVPHVPRMYEGLYLQNRIIGFLSWRSVDSVEGEANTTLDTVDGTNLTDILQIEDNQRPNITIGPGDARNLTGILQTGNHEGPNSVQKRSSSFIDEDDPNLVISYTFIDRDCDWMSFLSALIEGMAIVSSKDKADIADAINPISAAGDFTINIDGTQTPSTFRWIDMLRCLRDLWQIIVMYDQDPRDMDFEIIYRGSRVAEGHTLTI